MKKWIALILVLAGAAYGVPKLRQLKLSGAPTDTLNRATTALVENRDIRFSVTAAGDIGPREQVSVRPEVNGRIAELPVDIGDLVKKDSLLFSLDDRDLQIERQSKDKEAERAKLQLDQSQRDQVRARELFEDRLISEELYEQTGTQYALAKNALERAQKELDLVNDKIRKTRIVAPFDCTVLTRPVSIGQAVSGSGGFNSGTEVLSIADLHEMVINAHINQADVTRLKVDQKVQVEVEAVPGLEIVGTVERVAPQATIKNNIKGFAARILLRDVDPRVRPGMTANIKIPVATADNVMAVPLAAVFTETNPETGESERYAYVKQGESFERRRIRMGIADFFFAEVQEGLKAGEEVALELPKAELEKLAAQKTAAAGSTNAPRPAPR